MQFEPSLSPFTSQSSIALCSCGLFFLETLTFSQACLRSSIALALAIKYCLVLSRHPLGDTCTLTGSRRNCLVLSQHPFGNACTLTRTNQQPGCHRCWAAIVVRLPLLSGRHCCQAAIIIRLPIDGLSLLPHYLGLPPNGLFIVGLHRCPILLG
jgi:hypothetical protein